MPLSVSKPLQIHKICLFLSSINAELMPEYFHAAYIFGCKINTAISANKPKYTFLLVTSVCYLYYIIYCYTCVDFENKISKISSWDKVKCVDDTCMWARSIEAACVWFDLCAHNGITLNPKKFQFTQDTVDFAPRQTFDPAQRLWMP